MAYVTILDQLVRAKEASMTLAQRLPIRRIAIAVTIMAGLLVAVLMRHYLLHGWSFLVSAIGFWFLGFSHSHPHLSRLFHVALNLVPDLEFLLLALAGLGYLVPSFMKRLENSRTLRWSIFSVFLAFALVTVVVNAINREEEDNTRDNLNSTIATQGTKITEEGRKVDSLSNTDIQILQSLVSSRTLSEADRREALGKALRNEFITTHDPIDPEILAGNRMPPDDWMNHRLAQLGEKWEFASPKPAAQPVVFAGVPSPEPKAVVVFGFYSSDIVQQPLTTVQFADMQADTLTFSISAFVKGDVAAKSLQIWVRRCADCEWVGPPPPGFSPGDPDHPYDDGFFVASLPPNVSMARWNFVIRVPRYPRYSTVTLGAYYACENCPTVNWTKPQKLIETNNLHDYLSQLPSIPDTPEPVKQ